MTRQLLHRYNIHSCIAALRIVFDSQLTIATFTTRPVHQSHYPARAIARNYPKHNALAESGDRTPATGILNF